MKVLAGLSTALSSISDVVDQIVPISKRRQVMCIISKLVIAACAYFIWQERNWRLFRLQKRTVAQDCQDCEDSRALSFVFHLQEFHILSFILGIQNGYLRKGRKTKPNRQNRTRNGKAGKDKVKSVEKVVFAQAKRVNLGSAMGWGFKEFCEA
ncbi:hypothetical protein Tco_1499851 [Tanacetum coccineum]